MNSSVARCIVAIDGPAASGKSSVARALAQRLRFVYVNSGAMYRAVTWHILQRGIDPREQTAIARAAEVAEIVCDLERDQSRIWIEGQNPVEQLREPAVNDAVSAISSVPRVREILVAKMRAYAQEHDVVMEGRDIGSVVFPLTPYKFYIDALPDIRSRRRAAEGQRDQIAARDQADLSRRASPLVIAPDAHFIDTSDLSIEEVVAKILAKMQNRGLVEVGGL